MTQFLKSSGLYRHIILVPTTHHTHCSRLDFHQWFGWCSEIFGLPCLCRYHPDASSSLRERNTCERQLERRRKREMEENIKWKNDKYKPPIHLSLHLCLHKKLVQFMPRFSLSLCSWTKQLSNAVTCHLLCHVCSSLYLLKWVHSHTLTLGSNKLESQSWTKSQSLLGFSGDQGDIQPTYWAHVLQDRHVSRGGRRRKEKEKSGVEGARQSVDSVFLCESNHSFTGLCHPPTHSLTHPITLSSEGHTPTSSEIVL